MDEVEYFEDLAGECCMQLSRNSPEDYFKELGEVCPQRKIRKFALADKFANETNNGQND